MPEAQAPETAPSAESPPAAVPGEKDATPESSTGPADATAAEPPKKKSGGFQKRIDKLTRQVYEQAAIIEALKAAKPEAGDDKEPKRDDFEDLESYQKALAEHTARRVLREHQESEKKSREESRARSEQARRLQAWEAHAEKIAAKHEDGEDVAGHFVSSVELHPYALDAILESELGSEIAYYLGKHDEEAARIAKLSPARQASEIGKLEAKLSEAQKKVSSAPAPIDPVKGKGAAETGLSNDLPMQEWIKRRNKQLGR